MARERSEVMRDKIIKSAIHVFSENELFAAVRDVSRHARVGEGTVFIYFSTKKMLMEGVYHYVLNELHSTITTNLDINNATESKLFTVWKSCIDWSLRFEGYLKVYTLLENSKYISDTAREGERKRFMEIDELINKHGAWKLDENYYPRLFFLIFESTSKLIIADPNKFTDYVYAGFSVIESFSQKNWNLCSFNNELT